MKAGYQLGIEGLAEGKNHMSRSDRFLKRPSIVKFSSASSHDSVWKASCCYTVLEETSTIISSKRIWFWNCQYECTNIPTIVSRLHMLIWINYILCCQIKANLVNIYHSVHGMKADHTVNLVSVSMYVYILRGKVFAKRMNMQKLIRAKLPAYLVLRYWFSYIHMLCEDCS